MYQKRQISLSGQKIQETGNDCDVISALKVSGKTDFSDISHFLINNALLYQFLANLLAQNQKMTEKSVFRENEKCLQNLSSRFDYKLIIRPNQIKHCAKL